MARQRIPGSMWARNWEKSARYLPPMSSVFWPRSIRMAEPVRRRLEQFLLMLMLCLAIAAFGAAYDQPFAWAFALPCVLSIFWQIKRIPRWLRASTQSIAYLFELLAVVLGFIFMAYPVLSAQTATLLSLIAGYGLCAFASLFLLGMPAWPAAYAL